MYVVIYDIFYSVAGILLQILAGCLLFCLYSFNQHFLHLKSTAAGSPFMGLTQHQKLSIIFSSLIGSLLPMNTYGLAPIIIGLCLSGTGASIPISMLVSNFIFNMSIPFTEMNFVWKANIIRMVVAVAAGVALGLLTYKSGFNRCEILRRYPEEDYILKSKGIPGFIKLYYKYISSAGLFVVVGAALNVIFYRYIFYLLLKQLYSSPLGSGAINTFMGLDVADPMFAAAGQILNRIMNLSVLSAFAFLCRIRSVLAFYGYFLLIIILLSIPIFL